MGENNIVYFRGDASVRPEPGDIVLYDRVFCGKPHDHIGIVIWADAASLTTAEGNIGDSNQSGLITRARDEHIRAFIRLPEEPIR